VTDREELFWPGDVEASRVEALALTPPILREVNGWVLAWKIPWAKRTLEIKRERNAPYVTLEHETLAAEDVAPGLAAGLIKRLRALDVTVGLDADGKVLVQGRGLDKFKAEIKGGRDAVARALQAEKEQGNA
jgi:hypothetical protein